MMRMDYMVFNSNGDRPAGRWLIIAVAVLVLCSCRGLDSQMAGVEQPPSIHRTILDQQAASPAQRIAQVSHDTHLTASEHASATSSLSDRAAEVSAPAPPSQQTPIVPVGHTVPIPQAVLPADAPALVESTNRVPQAMVQVSRSGPTAYAPPYVLADPQTCSPSYAQPYGPLANGCQAQPWCPGGVPCGPWRPPGLTCPWPDDEYLCDGGDALPSVRVRQDWSLDGLEMEDTVVHYDTIDGDTHVEPSNRVCLYAPRFASVRKVYGIAQYDYLDRIARVDQPVPIEGLGDVQIATTSVQPVRPGLNLGAAAASGIRERTPPIGLDNRQGLVATQGSLLPYEDYTDLQRAMLDNSEKARLAELIQAAMVWSHDTAVQVLIDNIATHEDVSLAGTQSVYLYSLEGKPRLRVCKLASRTEARPGETVEFTLQFENVGDQVIGNVTVVDNLTTRLEYVEDSQTCSLEASFSSAINQGESATLRWEITPPMKVGEGGVIRFTCRVR